MKNIRPILGSAIANTILKVSAESSSLTIFGVPRKSCIVSRTRNSVFKIKDFTNIALTK